MTDIDEAIAELIDGFADASEAIGAGQAYPSLRGVRGRVRARLIAAIAQREADAERRGAAVEREAIFEALQSCRVIDALAATWGGNGDAMAAMVSVIRALTDATNNTAGGAGEAAK